MRKRKRIRKVFIYLAIVLGLFIAGSLLAILCFRTGIFSGIDVFFYRGIVLILFWGSITSILLLFLRQFFFKDVFLIRDAAMFFVVFCSVNIVFFTHVPVTADRSISVFMLGYMADHDTELFTEEEIEQYFIDRYVKDFGAFDKRFHEQAETGTIEEVSPGQYRITESGEKLMTIYEKVAELYVLDDKLIHSGT